MFKRICSVLTVAAILLPTLLASEAATTTPIKYVVVIFQENNSFDHYFGTYPHALYPQGLQPNGTNTLGESPLRSPAEHAGGQWPFLLFWNNLRLRSTRRFVWTAHSKPLATTTITIRMSRRPMRPVRSNCSLAPPAARPPGHSRYPLHRQSEHGLLRRQHCGDRAVELRAVFRDE